MVVSDRIKRLPTRVPTTGRLSSQFVSPPRNAQRSRSTRSGSKRMTTVGMSSNDSEMTTREIMQQLQSHYEPLERNISSPRTPPSVAVGSGRHNRNHDAALMRLEAAENELSEIMASRSGRSKVATPKGLSASKRLAAAKSALEELRSANLAVVDFVESGAAPPSHNPSLGKLLQQKASARVQSRQQQYNATRSPSPQKSKPESTTHADLRKRNTDGKKLHYNTHDDKYHSEYYGEHVSYQSYDDNQYKPVDNYKRSGVDSSLQIQSEEGYGEHSLISNTLETPDGRQAADIRRREYRTQRRTQDEVPSAVEQVAFLQRELSTRDDENHQLQDKHDHLLCQVSSLEEQLNDSLRINQTNTSTVSKQLFQSKLNQVESLEKELVVLQSKQKEDNTPQEEFSSALEQIKSLQTELSKQLTTITSLEKELSFRDEEITLLKSEQRQESVSQEEFSSALEKIESLRTELSSKITTVTSLEKELSSKDEEITILRTEQRHADTSQEELSAALEEIKTLRRELEIERNKTKSLEQQLTSLKSQEEYQTVCDKSALLQQELSLVGEQLNKTRQENQKMQTDDKTPELIEVIDQLRLELNAADDKGIFLSNELDNARKNAESLRSALIETNEETNVKLIEAEANGYLRGEQKAETLVKIEKSEIANLQKQLFEYKNIESENTALKQQVSKTNLELISRNENANASAAMAEQSVAKLQSRLVAAEQELVVLSSDAALSNTRIETLQHQLTEAEDIVNTSDEIEKLRNKEFEDLSKSLEKLRSELTEKTNEYMNMQSLLRSSSTTQSEQDAKASKLITDLQQQLVVESETCSALQQKSDELSNKCDELQHQNKHYEEVVKSVTERYDAVRDQEGELTNLRDNCERLIRENEFQAERIEEKDKELGELEKTIAIEKQQVDDYQKQSSRLSLELQQQKSKNDSSDTQDSLVLSPVSLTVPEGYITGGDSKKRRPASGVQFLDNYIQPPDDSEMPQIWSPVRSSVVTGLQNVKLSRRSSGCSLDLRPTSFSGGDLFVDKRFSGSPLDSWIPQSLPLLIENKTNNRLSNEMSAHVAADESGPSNAAPSPEGLSRDFFGQEAVLLQQRDSPISDLDRSVEGEGIFPGGTVHSILQEASADCVAQLSDITHSFSSLDAIRDEFTSTRDLLQQQNALDSTTTAAVEELEDIYTKLREALLHYRMDFEGKQNEISDMMEAVTEQEGSQYL